MAIHRDINDQYLDAMGIQVYRERGVNPAEENVSAKQSVAPVTFETLAENVKACSMCSGVNINTQRNLSEGVTSSDWFVVSDKVTENGLLLSKQSSQLFSDILSSVNERSGDCYLTSVVKCTHFDSVITSNEQQNCSPYLIQQIHLVQPKVVLLLGEKTAQHLLSTTETIEQLRGKKHNLFSLNVPVVVTYHPDQLLESPQLKRAVWQDIQLAQAQGLN